MSYGICSKTDTGNKIVRVFTLSLLVLELRSFPSTAKLDRRDTMQPGPLVSTL
jgi:hypothetical protein